MNRIGQYKSEGFTEFREFSEYNYKLDKQVWKYGMFKKGSANQYYKITIYEFEKNAKHGLNWLKDNLKPIMREADRYIKDELIGKPYNEVAELNGQNIYDIKDDYIKLLKKCDI